MRSLSRVRSAVLVGVLVVLLGASGLLVGTMLGEARGSTAPAVAPTYTVTFSETGLPSGTVWSVHVASLCACTEVSETVHSNTSTLTVSVGNGTYSYRVPRLADFYVKGTAHGTFNVSGAATAVPAFAFVPLTTYAVSFAETGLPGGTLWQVHVAGNGTGQLWSLEHLTRNSTSASITFTLPNGTYLYHALPVTGSYFVTPSHGEFNVSGGSPATITIGFVTPAAFAFGFTETGLPSGTNWSVRVYGYSGNLAVHLTGSSDAGSITFRLPNGTFHYLLSEVLGFGLNRSPIGAFSVTGAPRSFAFTFAALNPGAFYHVTFHENGLANGSHWSVRVGSLLSFGPSGREVQSSNNSTVTFALQNGTYRYHPLPVRGYTLAVTSGKLTVAGSSPAPIIVNFTAIPTYTVTFHETGLPTGTVWSVLVRTLTEGSTVYPVYVTVSSNTTNVTVNVPNGAYCYRVNPVVGWQVSTGIAKGTLSVSGGPPATVALTFSPAS